MNFTPVPPRPWRSARARIAGRQLASALAIAVGALACGRVSAPPPVVWVVVDTLRADHLEWYGYERETAPELATLVADGVLFEQARTPQPETTPAIASMFTGLYPAGHGVQALYRLLHDRNLTAAEILTDAGYDTAAFVSSFVMIRDFSGLGQGFALYDDFVTERELYRNNYERRAGETLARAADWLIRRRGERPFFLFIHLIDPHGPYAPPDSFATRFRSESVIEVQGEIPASQQIPGVRDLNRYRDLYDGEIAYAHERLGSFIEVLRRSGLYEDTLFVYSADHGESMGERGLYFTHGDDVYDENLRVPLIIKPPRNRAMAAGRRVAESVSLVDLLPTVLELVALPVPAGLDGRSLVPWIEGRGDTRPPVFAATGAPAIAQACRVAGGAKVMLHGDAARASCSAFDLASDPAERSPRPAPEAEARQLAAWRRQCLEFRRPFVVRDNFMAYALRDEFVEGRVGQQDREDAQRLRSLGYLH